MKQAFLRGSLDGFGRTLWRPVVLVVCLVSPLLASAATRAWWRFDEHPAGTQTKTATETFLNAVDEMTFPGVPREQNNAVLTSGGAQMPTYQTAFPTGHYLYDPVSDTVYPNDVAIWCGTASGGPNGRSGCVTIDDEGLYGDTFTLEFMIRCAKYQTSTWETILTRLNADGKTALVLRQLNGNFMGSYAYLEDGERVSADLAKFNTWVYGDVLNEKWHHIAVSVDQVALEMKVYVDYQRTQTIALPGRLDVDGPGTLRLGIGTDSWGGNFSGLIDEVRVSDVVLGPEQFLHVQRKDRADVVAYRSFTPASDEFAGGNVLRGEIATTLASGGSSAVAPVSEHAQSVTMHVGATAVANTDATNLKRAYFKVPCTDAEVKTGDFTIEMMVRLPEDGLSSGQNYLLHHTAGIIADFEGRKLLVKNPSWATFASLSFADTHWHHFAYVVDRANGNVKVYLDYTLIGTGSFKLSDIGDASTLFVGSYDASGSNVFGSLDLDEFRVSRGALEPAAFVHPAGGTDEDFCLVSFDATDFSSWGMGFGGKVVTRDTWGVFAVDGEDRPCAIVHDGRDDQTGYSNRVSAAFLKGSSGNFGGFYRIPDKVPSLTAGSFTAEMFVKVDSKSFGGANEQTPCFLGLLNGFRLVYQYWNDAVAALDCQGKSVASAPFALGKWYHLAYVQDVEKNQIRFYVNRKLVGTKNSIPAAAAATGANVYVMGSPEKDYYGTFTAARADEIRLTASVLGPDEFLTNKPRQGFVLIVR